MGILSRFTEPPKPTPPGFRCRTLVLMLCALALMIFCSLTATRTPTDRSDLYEGVVLILAFLFYFVAYEFAWPKPVNVILRVPALIGFVSALFYAFYTPTPTSRSDPYRGVVVILAFLLLFLANRFAWPTRVTVILRVLALIGFVFALFYAFYRPTPTSSPDPYGGVVVILAFLFYLVAYQFAWPKRVTIIVRVLAWMFFIFTLFYIFYLSHVLYPLPPVPLK